jgi:glycogen synthase
VTVIIRVYMIDKKQTKVLLVGDYPPPYGGVATHIVSLAEGINKIGIETHVLDIGTNRKISRPQCLPTKGYFDFVKNILFFLRRGYLIHLHTNGHNAKSWFLVFISSLLSKIYGAPVITTFHSGISPSYLSAAPLFIRILAFLSCKMCEEIICVSPEIKNALSKILKDDAHLKVIPAFMGKLEEKILFSPSAGEFIKKHSPIISTVAHFSPEYGTPLLLDAIFELKKKFENIGLIIMGEGESSMIEKKINQLSIGDNVLISKGLQNGECLYAIQGSDLFVRPSYIDGDSIAVREAIYLGKPVLASDAVKRPSEVQLFMTGDVADLEEKMYLMLTWPTTDTATSKKCHNEDSLEKIVNVYNGVDY